MLYREGTIYLRSQIATSNTETENASLKDGRRYMPILDAMQTVLRKAFRRAFV